MTTPLDAAHYLAWESGIPTNGANPFHLQPLTDLGNAERLAADHGQDLRYVYPWDKWLVWDGRRWSTEAYAEVIQRAGATLRALYQEATALSQQADAEPDDAVRKQLSILTGAMHKWARQSESRGHLESMVKLGISQASIVIKPTQLDVEPWLFNCLSGTVDLRTGELLPHNRDHLITKLAPTEYDPSAECPQWLAFLDRVMAGNQALIDFLQRAVGYSLTGVIREHCLFVLYGTGRNGKSTFLNTFLSLMGDYAHKAPPDLLMLRQGETHPTERALLHGIRFAPVIETREGRRLDEVMLKELTGGDMVVARRMREDFWQFSPTHHLWVATNHKPIIRGTDWGVWSRFRLVPFLVTIEMAEQDPSLADKLKSEWPGILAWGVRGSLPWQSDGLMEPPEVWRATSAYRDEMDTLGGFLAERTELLENARCTAKTLYESYQAWAKANGERTITKTAFGLTLQERGFLPGRGAKGIRLWRGHRLLDESEQADMQSDMFTDVQEPLNLEF